MTDSPEAQASPFEFNRDRRMAKPKTKDRAARRFDPMTAMAVKYGATPDGAWDTFFPERCTRHTFRVFGPVILVGFALLAARWVLGL